MKRKIRSKVALLMFALFLMPLIVIILSCCKEEKAVKDEVVEPVVIKHTYYVYCCHEHEKEVTEDVREEKLEEGRKVNPKELEMLACLIYREAGADAVCDECRYRVADVVLNRINSDEFPDSMYEVLTQKKQYGTMHYDGITWPERANKPEEAHAVERAYDIARDVLSGNHSELYGQEYIWQAEFEQGSSGFWHCGIYFGK